MHFFTIGLYNTEETDFYRKLQENRIDTFCDIRRRRGVRGKKYAYANSKRLQSGLAIAGIRYIHILELAPTSEIRDLQKLEDAKTGISKTARTHLADDFFSAYQEIVLKHFNFQNFIKNLSEINASRIVFFCVEENPLACHRSIVVKALEESGFKKSLHL